MNPSATPHRPKKSRSAGAARLVVMFHQTRDGESKQVARCIYPLTAVRCVRTVVTDLGLIDVAPEGFVLREVAPGVSVDDVRRATAAPLAVASDVCEMTFE